MKQKTQDICKRCGKTHGFLAGMEIMKCSKPVQTQEKQCICEHHELYVSAVTGCPVHYPTPPDEELEKRFWLHWGIAPKGTLKYQKGIATLKLMKREGEVQYQIGYDDGHKNGWEERGKLLE